MATVESGIGVSRAVSGVVLFSIMNAMASLCFKECGTNAAHTWSLFIAGNALGMLSLIFIMWVYAGMNANLGGALLTGFSAMAVQFAFWLVYGAHMTPLQWVGVTLSIISAVMAVLGKIERMRRVIPVASNNQGETL